MNKNGINQTTPQENKNKSQNRKEDIRDHHKKTKSSTHPVEPKTWIKNKHWKTLRGPHQQTNLTKGPQPFATSTDFKKKPNLHANKRQFHLPTTIMILMRTLVNIGLTRAFLGQRMNWSDALSGMTLRLVNIHNSSFFYICPVHCSMEKRNFHFYC